MSRRIAEANKAITRAWEAEQQRVLEGNGTRDWTREQQQDILDRGKHMIRTEKRLKGII